MEKFISDKIKSLVADNRLEEALDLLLAQTDNKNRERHHTLILLKGQLDSLREQELADLLSFEDLSREKRKIARTLLLMTDGDPAPISPSDTVGPRSKPVPNTGTHFPKGIKYLLFVALALGGIYLFYQYSAGKTAPASVPDGPTVTEPIPTTKEELIHEDTPPELLPSNPSRNISQPAQKPIKVHDFPNLGQKFNFLDFQFDFQNVHAERMTDGEISLKINYTLTCRSNLDICHRASIRILADDAPFAPTDQTNLDGWIEHKTTIKDQLTFIVPANAKAYYIELSRDHSDWKRPFKILQ